MKRLITSLMVVAVGCSDTSSPAPKVTDQGTKAGPQQIAVPPPPPPAPAEAKSDTEDHRAIARVKELAVTVWYREKKADGTSKRTREYQSGRPVVML